MVLLSCVAGAQTSSTGATVAITNPVRQEAKPFSYGVLMQSGFGVTEERIAGVGAPAPGGRAYKGRLLVYRRVPFDAPGGPQ